MPCQMPEEDLENWREKAYAESNCFVFENRGGLIVQEAAVPLLSAWQNFYVIVGSASATLTGLMFVIVTLIASRGRHRSGEAIGAFGTPTVVHLCAALLIAAILMRPGRPSGMRACCWASVV